jgi:chitinase
MSRDLFRCAVVVCALLLASCDGADIGDPSGDGADAGMSDPDTRIDAGPLPPLEDRLGVAIYWGQNGYGGAHPGEPDTWERPLAQVCADPSYDIVLLGFLTSFVSQRNADGLPESNFSYHCDTPYDADNPFLLSCPDIGAAIDTCHANGKRVLLSLGGAAGSYGFTSDDEAEQFAHTVWDMFLGGSSAIRPLGTTALDGVDLDIEGGSTVGYTAFVARLRQLTDQDSSKRYLMTGAPQCPIPDAYLGPNAGAPLGDVADAFDYLFVQFYNNYCNFNQRASFDDTFEQWAALAASGGPAIYVGLPATDQAAQASSYVSREGLAALVGSVASHDSFAGIMLWDSSYDQNSADTSGTTYGAYAAELLRAVDE